MLLVFGGVWWRGVVFCGVRKGKRTRADGRAWLARFKRKKHQNEIAMRGGRSGELRGVGWGRGAEDGKGRMRDDLLDEPGEKATHLLLCVEFYLSVCVAVADGGSEDLCDSTMMRSGAEKHDNQRGGCHGWVGNGVGRGGREHTASILSESRGNAVLLHTIRVEFLEREDTGDGGPGQQRASIACPCGALN